MSPKLKMKEMLKKNNTSIKESLYQLSKLIDNGDGHVQLKFDFPTVVYLS